ncbi:MAG: hypothetical protein K6G58_10885 [Lachnospiraceae bacterium]|nr:hypothetical protein [Lachnospiraceae bacterium]
MRIKKISVRRAAAMLAAAILLTQIPALPVQASEIMSEGDSLMEPEEPDEPEERLVPVRIKAEGMEITLRDVNDPENTCIEAVTRENIDKYSADPYSCSIGDWIIHTVDDVTIEITVLPSDDDNVAMVIANFGEGTESEEAADIIEASGSMKRYDILIDDEVSLDIVEKEYKSVRFVTSHAEVSSYLNGDPFPQNTAKTVEGDKLQFTVSTDDYYHIESIRSGGEDIGQDPADSGIFTIPEVKDDMTVVVTAVPDDREISFYMKLAEPVEIEVDTEDGILYPDPVDDKKYVLTYMGDGIGFAFSPAEGEVPEVYYVGHGSAVFEAVAESVSPDGRYSYFIPWENIPVKSSIVIQNSHAACMQTVSIEYPSEGDPVKELSVICEGSELAVSEESDEDGVRKAVYEVEFGKTVMIQADMSDAYDVGQAEFNVSGEKDTYNLYGYSSYKRTLPVAGDINVRITPFERYELRIKESAGKYIIPSYRGIRRTSGNVTLEPGEYTVEVYKGKERMALTGGDVMFSARGSGGDFTGDGFGYDFSVSENSQRRSFTMELSCNVPATTRKIRELISVSLVPKLSELKAERVPDGGTLSTDSRKFFFISSNRGIGAMRSVSADLTRVDYRVTYGNAHEAGADIGKDSEYASAELQTPAREGAAKLQFRITSKYKETDPGKVLTIHFFDKKNPENDMLTVPFTIVKDPGIQETMPEASVSKSTDVSASLELPYVDFAKPKNGKTYYRIKVTPEAAAEGETAPADIIPEKTYYAERTYPVLLEYPDDAEDPDIEKTDKLNDKRRREYRQYVTVPLIDRAAGQGFGWDFDVEVSCVNIPAGSSLSFDGEADAAEKIYVMTGEDKIRRLKVSTLDPVYALAVSAKKLNDTLFAGEKDIAAAVLSYGKGTTCTAVTADVTDCSPEERLTVRVDDATDRLIVSSDGRTMIGKHTISITPAGREQGIYQKPAFVTVTVNKPIDEITVMPESAQYLKQKDKTLTVKFSTAFNQTSGVKPKTAKAVYYITDQYGTVIDEESPLYGYVKISNGSVTVDKSFEVPEDRVSTVFRIKAIADDYTENMTSGLSEKITIKRDPMKIGALMLLSYDGASRTYRTVARDGDSVTTDAINDAVVAALKENAPVKDRYYSYEMSEYLIDAGQLKFSTSNRNALTLQTDGARVYAGAQKAADNVTLTANTTDGGNENAKIRVNIIYDEPKELGLRIEAGGISAENQPFAFAGTPNTAVSVTVIKKDSDDSEWTELGSAVDYKLSVSGGSFITKDEASGRYKLSVKGEKAVLKLAYNKKTSQYDVTNSAYSTYRSNTVSVKQNGTLICNYGAHQDVDLVFSGSRYDFNGKYVLLCNDWQQAAKKPEEYGRLNSACAVLNAGLPVGLEEKDGKPAVTLGIDGKVPAFGYKLSAVAGRIEDGAFIPEAKPVTFTLSVSNPKPVRGSFRPSSALRISKRNPEAAFLADTGTELKSLAYTKIYNCNIKGAPNRFTDYFDFTPTGEGIKAEIRLKEGLTAEQKEYIMGPKGSADRTAFVEYDVSYGDDGYGNPLTVTTAVVRISVSFTN